MSVKSVVSLQAILFMILLFSPPLSFGASEFEKWKAQEMGSYEEFRDERDRAFTAYLKEQWQEFKLFQGEKSYKEPKPVKLPVAKPVPPKEVVPFKGTVVTPPPAEPAPLPPVAKESPEKVPPPPVVKRGKGLKIDFYGTEAVMTYDPALKVNLGSSIDKNSISAYWEALSKPDYEALLAQLDHYKKELKLNDWGYHLFVYRTGERIYGPSKRETTLFVWFMLSKAGYETKVGYNDDAVFLLLPTKNKLYGIPYLTLNNQRYYALSFDGSSRQLGSLYTYKGQYPDATERMDYGIRNTPDIAREPQSRTLHFTYRGEKFSLPVQYDKGVVKFFEYYPQTDFEVYFAASTSPEAGTSLVKGLKPIVAGKTEGEAVNIILRFVQTAFEYKTDDGQFGREKYMLPDETLYYPYSDCEDRSILFAFLVQSLTGLDVVALHYPNHIATAVAFTNGMEGDYVVYGGKKYLISDPTYINADIGMVMPRFKGVKPEVIPVRRAL